MTFFPALGTEVDIGPGDIVLDGEPALPRERGTTAPTYTGLGLVLGLTLTLTLLLCHGRATVAGEIAEPRRAVSYCLQRSVHLIRPVGAKVGWRESCSVRFIPTNE